jgi:hypothetical protein
MLRVETPKADIGRTMMSAEIPPLLTASATRADATEVIATPKTLEPALKPKKRSGTKAERTGESVPQVRNDFVLPPSRSVAHPPLVLVAVPALKLSIAPRTDLHPLSPEFDFPAAPPKNKNFLRRIVRAFVDSFKSASRGPSAGDGNRSRRDNS